VIAPSPVIVVAALILHQGKILLAQRDNTRDNAGLWEFPGGKVETGESQPQALQRELQEELALTIEVDTWLASHCWQKGNKTLELHGWLVNHYSGQVQLHCHSAIQWVTIEQAQQLPLAPADIPLLAALKKHLADHTKTPGTHRP
jgi:(d)CTP diphosphatase